MLGQTTLVLTYYYSTLVLLVEVLALVADPKGNPVHLLVLDFGIGFIVPF